MKMAENRDVTNFTRTAKTEGTWVIFLSFFLSSVFPNSKEHGNTNQGPRVRAGKSLFASAVRYLGISPSFVSSTVQHGHIAPNPRFYPHPRCPCTRNLPAPSMPMYPQFTRTLVFLTRNLPAPSILFTHNLPAPSFFYPQFTRPRGTRRPSLPSHPRNPSPVHTRHPRTPSLRYLTRARALPVPVAPATRVVPFPVRFRPRSARRPSLPNRPYPSETPPEAECNILLLNNVIKCLAHRCAADY